MTMYGKIAYRLLRERLSKTLTVLAGIFLSAFLIAALETSIVAFLLTPRNTGSPRLTCCRFKEGAAAAYCTVGRSAMRGFFCVSWSRF